MAVLNKIHSLQYKYQKYIPVVSAQLSLVEVQVEGLYYHQEERINHLIKGLVKSKLVLVQELNQDPQPSTSLSNVDWSSSYQPWSSNYDPFEEAEPIEETTEPEAEPTPEPAVPPSSETDEDNDWLSGSVAQLNMNNEE